MIERIKQGIEGKGVRVYDRIEGGGVTCGGIGIYLWRYRYMRGGGVQGGI